MEILFGIAVLAAMYFYDLYKKEQKARFIEHLDRELEESSKRIANLIAEEVAGDLAAGLTIEGSADKNATLHQAHQNRIKL